MGPLDPLRARSADDLIPIASAAARAAGVTRLADVTRLDPIGFPVWQAIRPMSRALSVHQGKGAGESEAMLGALLEAAESHAAEKCEADGPECAFADLPRQATPPEIGDFGFDRNRPPDRLDPCRWVEAEDLLGGGPLFLPFDLVSLDLTQARTSLFDRTSNGVATGGTREEAIVTALHEFVERDAVTEWRATGLVARMKCAIDEETIRFGWFSYWNDRIAAAGADLIVYHVPSVTGSPVFACEISDSSKEGRAYRAVQGRGCHPVPEIALFKAVAEALQSRVTYIAGARDDLMPSHYTRSQDGIVVAFGLPLPPDMAGLDFDAIEEGPRGIAALGEALASAGYDRIGVVDLADWSGLHVVRAFICGLGSMHRRRRAPIR